MASVFMIPSSSTAPFKQKEKDDEDLEVSDTFSRKNGTNIFVGDKGTTRNIRSVRLSASDIYEHVSENPEDLHFGGYMFESIATSQGPGGLYFAAHDVLGKNFSKFVVILFVLSSCSFAFTVSLFWIQRTERSGVDLLLCISQFQAPTSPPG